jgi:3-dehydroquinate dehydratase-2
MSKVLVINGPNLNRLGTREPAVYGTLSYAELVANLEQLGNELGLDVEIRQTNDEAELISWLHEAVDVKANVVLNPAAFTHYSYSLRDACAIVTTSGLQLIEVHLSNPHAREEFRHTSVISGVASGVIAGFGIDSYRLALSQLSN